MSWQGGHKTQSIGDHLTPARASGVIARRRIWPVRLEKADGNRTSFSNMLRFPLQVRGKERRNMNWDKQAMFFLNSIKNNFKPQCLTEEAVGATHCQRCLSILPIEQSARELRAGCVSENPAIPWPGFEPRTFRFGTQRSDSLGYSDSVFLSLRHSFCQSALSFTRPWIVIAQESTATSYNGPSPTCKETNLELYGGLLVSNRRTSIFNFSLCKFWRVQGRSCCAPMQP